MRNTALGCSLLLLAACARSEDASTLPDTNGVVPVEMVKAPQTEDRQVAIGDWRDGVQDEGASLEFGPAGAAPLFSMRCDDRGGLVLQRHGVPPVGDLPIMIVTVGNDTRRLAVTGGSGPIPMVRATLTPRHPLLAALAEEGSSMTIRVGDTPPLTLPPSAEIAEFLRRCASGDSRQAQPMEEEAAQENDSDTANESAPAR